MMINFGSRRLFLCDLQSFKCIEGGFNAENYALLLPAATILQVEVYFNFASQVVRQGCTEVCCVGEFSSALEDALDAMLEVEGNLEVATTSLLEEGEALEYFLYGVGGAEPGLDLVAVVERNSTLRRALDSLIS